mgnify:CR=1 FL=1
MNLENIKIRLAFYDWYVSQFCFTWMHLKLTIDCLQALKKWACFINVKVLQLPIQNVAA